MRLIFALPLISVLLAGTSAFANEMKIGLQDDLDGLDPVKSRTFVGEVVFKSLCDSLVSVGADLKAQPALASRWSWNGDNTELTMTLFPNMTFHDGSQINAQAVKANLDRSITQPDSMRKSELQSIDSVSVVDDLTFKIKLKRPDPTLLPQLSNRAGMMMSPARFDSAVTAPVCSGPYRFVSRQQNYSITLEKFQNYRDAADYHFDKVTFMIMPDTTVRLANLRSGGLDMLERLAPSDIASVKSDPNLQLAAVTSVGYQGLTINVGNGSGGKSPLGKDKRVRQALQLAIDKDAINQVVGAGTFEPAQQPFTSISPFHDTAIKVSEHNVDKAKALLAEAGTPKVSFELIYANSTTSDQIAQMMQAMGAEAGFDIKLHAVEFTTMLTQAQSGDFDAVLTGWSGRYDPDGNIHQFLACKNSLNYAGYCNSQVTSDLDKAKVEGNFDARKKLYDDAQNIIQDDLPIIYLYHQPWPFVLSRKVHGFQPLPTGLISLKGVTKDD